VEHNVKIGIEQEIVFKDSSGQYLDADNTPYSLFGDIVDVFPSYEGDDAYLECKSLETYPKRCYVEGFERHNAGGRVIETIPKGLEIRTLPYEKVADVVAEFRESFGETMRLAGLAGLSPVMVSRHPFKSQLALNDFADSSEQAVRSELRLKVAKGAMLSHGLHVNVSVGEYSSDQMQDLAEKVNYYTPSIIPWSYSSPFYEGTVFEGLCARNYFRAGSRSMAGLEERKGALVLEFRGFDACAEPRLLSALLMLFRGFVLDQSLPGRSPGQDVERLMRSSLSGFADSEFEQEGIAIVNAAKNALGPEGSALVVLEEMLQLNDSSSARMKRCYGKTGSIMDSISGLYSF